MTLQDRYWWEQMRAQGRGSLILRGGILHHGIQVSFAVLVLQVTFIILFSRDSVPHITLALTWVVDAIIFGSLIGHVLWKQHEKDYHKDDHAAAHGAAPIFTFAELYCGRQLLIVRRSWAKRPVNP
jgi:hypothetical protein